MEVLILQVFVSLVLVGGSIILFSYSAKQKDHHHAGRLALLPLEGDEAKPRREARAPAPPDRNRTEFPS
jgi:hypothetical protein